MQIRVSDRVLQHDTRNTALLAACYIANAVLCDMVHRERSAMRVWFETGLTVND